MRHIFTLIPFFFLFLQRNLPYQNFMYEWNGECEVLWHIFGYLLLPYLSSSYRSIHREEKSKATSLQGLEETQQFYRPEILLHLWSFFLNKFNHKGLALTHMLNCLVSISYVQFKPDLRLDIYSLYPFLLVTFFIYTHSDSHFDSLYFELYSLKKLRKIVYNNLCAKTNQTR